MSKSFETFVGFIVGLIIPIVLFYFLGSLELAAKFGVRTGYRFAADWIFYLFPSLIFLAIYKMNGSKFAKAASFGGVIIPIIGLFLAIALNI